MHFIVHLLLVLLVFAAPMALAPNPHERLRRRPGQPRVLRITLNAHYQNPTVALQGFSPKGEDFQRLQLVFWR